MPWQAGHGREMIEIDRDRPLLGGLHQAFDIGDQSVVGYALVVKWRQHQRATEAELGRVTRERNGIGDGSSAGADHQSVHRQAILLVGAHHAFAFVDRK